MKVWYSVIEENGTVAAKGCIEGSPQAILKGLFSVAFSGEHIVQEIKDAYNLFDLDSLSAEEVVAKLLAELEKDEEAVYDAFQLDAVTDEAPEFLNGVLSVLSGAVGTDYVEVSECQTMILLKLADRRPE